MRKIPFILILGLAGAWFLLMTFAFATMIDPRFEGQAWWREYWGKIFHDGWPSIVPGLVLIGTGLYVAALGGRQAPQPRPARHP